MVLAGISPLVCVKIACVRERTIQNTGNYVSLDTRYRTKRQILKCQRNKRRATIRSLHHLVADWLQLYANIWFLLRLAADTWISMGYTVERIDGILFRGGSIEWIAAFYSQSASLWTLWVEKDENQEFKEGRRPEPSTNECVRSDRAFISNLASMCEIDDFPHCRRGSCVFAQKLRRH